MKWVIFGLALVVGVPIMVGLMGQRERFVRLVMGAFFFTLVYDISVNVISMESYRGSSRGIEIVVSDLVLLALALHLKAVPPKGSAATQKLSREGVAFLFYGLIGVCSIFGAMVPMYALFGMWKLIRGLLVFFVFYRLIDRRERVETMLLIYAAMVIYQAPWVVLQKYGMGLYRATGTLSHMNTLAMMNNLLMVPLFAVLFLSDGKTRIWYMTVIAAGVFNVLSTASRGALVSMLMAMVSTLLFLRPRMLNASRVSVLAAGFFGAVIVGIQAADTIIERFNEAPAESEETRHGFNICAAWMARDFVFGVGINNYSYAIGKTAYGEAAPDLADDEGKDDGVAHHIYWLTASEMGWIGLASMIILYAAVHMRCLTLGLFARNRLYSAIGIGCCGGLAALHLQGTLEWVFRQTLVWYLFCSQAALLSAMGRMDREERLHGDPSWMKAPIEPGASALPALSAPRSDRAIAQAALLGPPEDAGYDPLLEDVLIRDELLEELATQPTAD